MINNARGRQTEMANSGLGFLNKHGPLLTKNPNGQGSAFNYGKAPIQGIRAGTLWRLRDSLFDENF